MNCSFSSSLNNPKPFLSRTTLSQTPKRNHVPSFSFSCRSYTGGDRNGGNAAAAAGTDFYKVLSLESKEASVDEIKKAYRTMARRYHPDVCHPSMKQECTRMFVQLHAAYRTLSDPVLRQEYDCRLSSRNFHGSGSFSADYSEQFSRIRWREQMQELKRRSNNRMAQSDGSWGNRMRSRNNQSMGN